MESLKVNGVIIVEHPAEFKATVLDLDDGETSGRTANGDMNRDRIAVKRQIYMKWGILPGDKVSALLKSLSGVYCDFYYPDPQEGKFITKKFYGGNRPVTFVSERNGVILWSGLEITLTEQ